MQNHLLGAVPAVWVSYRTHQILFSDDESATGQAWKLKHSLHFGFGPPHHCQAIVCVGPDMAKRLQKGNYECKKDRHDEQDATRHIYERHDPYGAQIWDVKMLPQPNMCILPQEVSNTLNLDGILS